MKHSFLFISATVLLLLQNCILFKKEISKPVVIKIIETENYVQLKQNANYIKYVASYSESDYASAFMTSFSAEGSATKNITIDNNAAAPDYLLAIKSVEITESDFTETVTDSKSEFNGKQFLLNKIDVTATVDCIDAKTNKKIGLICTNTKSKQEKLKNNRNLGDLISGSNKDHSTYRQKTLNDNIAKQLTEDVGRRIWVPISKRIKKSLK